MDVRRILIIGVGSALAIFAVIAALPAEGDPLQKADGTEQEIGTFGVFPDSAFKAETSRARAYSFPLPKELAADPVKLKIEVVPDKERGTGEGAQLEIGHAEIQ